MTNYSASFNDSKFDGTLIQGENNKVGDQSVSESKSMSNTSNYNNHGQAGAMGDNATSNNSTFVQQQQSEKKQTLSDAAKEIQELLKQLEVNNSTASQAEKIAHVNDETTPSFKRRVVGALQAGTESAIEEFLANPYVNVVKETFKGWMKPE